MAWFAAVAPALMSMVGGQGAKEGGLKQAWSQARQGVREDARSLTEEKDFRDREKRMLATGRVIGAAQGTTDEGSPLLLASDLAGEIETQAMRIRHGGQLRSRRMAEQTQFTIDAALRAEDQSAMRAGGSLLKGAGSMYGSWGGGGKSNPAILSGPGYTTDYSGSRVGVA